MQSKTVGAKRCWVNIIRQWHIFLVIFGVNFPFHLRQSLFYWHFTKHIFSLEWLYALPSHFTSFCAEKNGLAVVIIILSSNDRTRSMLSRLQGALQNAYSVLQLLIGVKLLFQWKHKYLNLQETTEFDMLTSSEAVVLWL